MGKGAVSTPSHDPAHVEITRGLLVESVHPVSISIMDGDGATVLSLGDVAKPVFPRSAVKAIQALPLIESGAADALGFGDAELSLSCASHSGEDGHIETARGMLAKAGLEESVLECGGHWSSQAWVMRHQTTIWYDTPGPICNNCSGKHSGFVCTAAHNGVDPTGYIKHDHPVQTAVRDAMEMVTGAAHTDDVRAIDGCSIPTYAIPLTAMAHGFARMATGRGLGDQRAKAAQRLLNACMASPFHMAGTNRFCTKLMSLGDNHATNGRLFAKTGAEGVFCGALPELGLGIALKCEDGTTRAAEAMMAAVFAHLLPNDDALQDGLKALAAPTLKNWNGMEVGTVRAVL